MKYHPIKIINPLSDGRLVKLQHEQKIHLIITDQYSKNLSVDFSSETLCLDRSYCNDDGYHYIISHKIPLEHHGWDGISKFFVGEITIISELVASSLCVVLEGNHNIIVSNPKSSYLRFEPHHTVEVISSSSYSIEDGMDGLGLMMECLSERFNGISYNYIFKLDSESLEKLRATEKKGLYDGGKIYFDDNVLNLCVSHRKSHIIPVFSPQKKRPQICLPFYQQAELHEIPSSLEEGCKIIWID
jgi:hypothetical protein